MYAIQRWTMYVHKHSSCTVIIHVKLRLIRLLSMLIILYLYEQMVNSLLPLLSWYSIVCKSGLVSGVGFRQGTGSSRFWFTLVDNGSNYQLKGSMFGSVPLQISSHASLFLSLSFLPSFPPKLTKFAPFPLIWKLNGFSLIISESRMGGWMASMKWWINRWMDRCATVQTYHYALVTRFTRKLT